MQRNTLDDKIVPDKQQWDVAVKFMEETLREKLQQSKKWGKKVVWEGGGGN
jgi:cobalamin biosynthesis Mg chelatase CobN